MKIIIPIIVGATIGYFTNWLAIKMLFRPHYEKRILGIKLPFTPGLIPKEKDRIAKSIGEAVGDYLLSPETIIDALSNEEVDRSIKLKITRKIEELKVNQKTIEETLENSLGDNFQSLREGIKRRIGFVLVNQIRKEDFKEKLFKNLAEKINNMKWDMAYSKIKDGLVNLIVNLPDNMGVKTIIIETIGLQLEELSREDRLVSEIVPEEIVALIFEYIEDNEREIGDILRKSFNDPQLQIKLKKFISELVSNNVSRIITTFLDPETIAEKVYHMIEKYIIGKGMDRILVSFIKSFLNSILESKASVLASKLSQSMDEERLDSLVVLVLEFIAREENHNIFIENLVKEIKESEGENKKFLISHLLGTMDKYLASHQLEEGINLLVEKLMDDLLGNTIGRTFKEVSSEKIEELYKASRKVFDKFAVNKLPEIIESFNISKIVEEKIQSFDVDFTEELILDIAHKELRAITNLGALLGGIMGLLTPILQMLY